MAPTTATSPLWVTSGATPEPVIREPRQWEQSKISRSPLYHAWSNEREGLSQLDTVYTSWEIIKPYFLRSHGYRAGGPTPLAHALLLGVKGIKLTLANQILGVQYLSTMASGVGMFMTVPSVPRKKKAYMRTALPGYQLLQFWAEKKPEFKKLYDGFVTEGHVNEAKGWATTLTLGLEIPFLKQRNEEAAVQYKIIEEEQKAMAEQQIKWQNAYSTVITSGFNTPTITDNSILSAPIVQPPKGNLLGALGGLFGHKK